MNWRRSRGLTPEMLVVLGEASIKTLDDLADLAADELVGIEGDEEKGILEDFGVTMAWANEVIMAARAHWFDDDDEPQAEGESADEEGGEAAEKQEPAAEAADGAGQ